MRPGGRTFQVASITAMWLHGGIISPLEYQSRIFFSSRHSVAMIPRLDRKATRLRPNHIGTNHATNTSHDCRRRIDPGRGKRVCPRQDAGQQSHACPFSHQNRPGCDQAKSLLRGFSQPPSPDVRQYHLSRRIWWLRAMSPIGTLTDMVRKFANIFRFRDARSPRFGALSTVPCRPSCGGQPSLVAQSA